MVDLCSAARSPVCLPEMMKASQGDEGLHRGGQGKLDLTGASLGDSISAHRSADMHYRMKLGGLPISLPQVAPPIRQLVSADYEYASQAYGLGAKAGEPYVSQFR